MNTNHPHNKKQPLARRRQPSGQPKHDASYFMAMVREKCGDLRELTPKPPPEPTTPTNGGIDTHLNVTGHVPELERLPDPFMTVRDSYNLYVQVQTPLKMPEIGQLLGTSTLSTGALRLFRLVHQLALDLVTHRQYAAVPSQVVIHQSNELIALALGRSVDSLHRYATELQVLGLISRRRHYTGSRHNTVRCDGTVWAIATKPNYRARLTYEDLSHQYRNLEEDREANRTAWSVLRWSDSQKGNADWYSILREWAITPGAVPGDTDENTKPRYKNCVVPDHRKTPIKTVPDVAYATEIIATCHHTKRAPLIEHLATSLAELLDDRWNRETGEDNVPGYCGYFWEAWRSEQLGQNGLSTLAAQILRLATDIKEWPSLKRPGALLRRRLNVRPRYPNPPPPDSHPTT